MYRVVAYLGLLIAFHHGDTIVDTTVDIIGTALSKGLDVYHKGKEYLHERKKTRPLRSVQGEWSTSTSAAARRAYQRREPLP